MHSRRNRVFAVVMLGAFTSVTAACHGGGGTSTTTKAASTTSAGSTSTSSASTSSTAVPASTTTRPTATTAPAPCGPSGTDTSFSIGAPSDTMLLKTVTARHTAPCTDTLAFTFSSSVASAPGVQISQALPPFIGVDGRARPVGGARFYRIRFEPASTFDFETSKPSYTGPTSFALAGASHIVQVVELDAFEGVVTWIVGVRAGDEFTPTLKASPPSLILTF